MGASGFFVAPRPIVRGLGADVVGLTDAQVDQKLVDRMEAERAQRQPLLQALAAAEPNVTPYTELGTPGSFLATTGNINQYGWVAGTLAAHNWAAAEFQAYDAAHLPKLCRVVVRQTNESGTVLADVTVPVVSVLNTPFWVLADLGVTVGDGATTLFYEFRFDGYVGYRSSGAAGSTSRYKVASSSLLTSAFNANLSPNNNPRLRYGTAGGANTWQSGVTATDPLTAVASTVSGFGCLVWDQGTAPKGYNRVELQFIPIDLTAVPTQARLRVRQGTETGTILADKTINVSSVYKVEQIATFDLDKALVPDGTALYVECFFDGRVSIRRVSSTTTVSAARPRYTTSGTIADAQTWNVDSNAGQLWMRLSTSAPDAQRLHGAAHAKQQIQAVVRELYTPTILLPGVIFAATGRECGIYWDNILKVDGPTPRIRSDIYDFDVVQAQSLGRQDSRGWVYTPVDGDAADRTLTINVYRENQLVATASPTLRIKAAAAGNGVTRKFVNIGDSTGVNTWQAELAKLFADGPGTMALSWQGSISATGTDSASGSQSIKHDAVSGKTLNYFYTDPASPFVFSGSFNFASYLAAQSITLASGDWVLIHLGINDMFAHATDAAAGAQIMAMETQLSAMITNIKAAVSGIRLALCCTIHPSYEQDAWGHDYGVGQTQWRYRRNWSMWVDRLIKDYDLPASNQYVFPIHAGLDVRNNMQVTSTAYNARNSGTFNKQSNGVHPAASGYYQMADQIYCGLKSVES